MMIRRKIRSLFKNLLKKEGLPEVEFVVEHPQEEGWGDYATNLALVLAKKMGKKPIKMAEKIVSLFLKPQEIEKVEAVPPGFINFWLSRSWLSRQIDRVLKEGEEYGASSFKKGEKIMVEFAHPNTLKPFHIGHLRNICLGEAIVRILEKNGAKVIRANYQGDVGLHIAKTLWQVRTQTLKVKKLKTLDEKIKFLGWAYAEGNRAYEEDAKAREEIVGLNEKIYQKDPQVLPLWKKTRQWSLDYFERIYKRVDSRFDRYYFESECVEGKEIAKEAVKKGILEESRGAIIFNGKKYGLDTRVFVNKLGFPTYEAKELKLAELEFSEFGELDRCIHVVGPEQISFFKVAFKVEELLDPKKYKGRQYHLVYGWVRLKTGKMSSRKGEVVLAEWLIDEVKRRLLSEFKMDEAVAEVVAVGAVKYSFLKFSPRTEIAFDISESINLEGDSGPYLQYTYARCKSVLKKVGRVLDFSRKLPAEGVEREEMAILRTVYQFPEVVLEAGERLAPNLICGFLFDLAQKYNTFYNKWPIIKAKSGEVRAFRLGLTAATAQILKNGLYLLGIKTLERM